MVLNTKTKESEILYTLKNGDQKLMTKSQHDQYLKRMESLSGLYESYVECGFIDKDGSVEEQVRQTIDHAVELMYTIGTTADKISISGYNRVKNEINHRITKGEFRDIVNFVLANKDKEKHEVNDEKFTKKLLDNIDKYTYKINLQKHFYREYIEDKDIVVPESPTKIIFPNVPYKTNKKFKEIIGSCVAARKYLNEKLWPAYREYADLAEYISRGELLYADFKQLVDYQYYTGDPDPRFQGQDKRWEALQEKFLKKYKLCKRWGYDEYFAETEATVFNFLRLEEEKENTKEDYGNVG